VTIVALPLTAVLVLHASPLQMGLISSAGFLPGALFGLFAGVIIDRLPKRRVLILANLFSAVTLAVVPLGEAGQFLSIALLLVISFIAALLASAEGIALLSFLPSVVTKNELAKANGKFSAAVSIARVVGPAAAGGLIAALSAPGAIAIDAISFLVAALLILAMPITRRAGRPLSETTSKTSMLVELRQGLNFIFKDRMLRMLIVTAAPLNFFGAAFNSLQALFIVRQLGVRPSWFGLALATAGLSAVLGALVSASISSRLDIVKLLLVALVMFIIADGNISILQGPPLTAALRFGASSALEGFAATVVGVAIMTYIQKAAPPQMLARVNGVLMTTFGAVMPLGALAGGAFGGMIGVRQTMIAATLGYVVILLAVLSISRRSA
jgi:MFS family permease